VYCYLIVTATVSAIWPDSSSVCLSVFLLTILLDYFACVWLPINTIQYNTIICSLGGVKHGLRVSVQFVTIFKPLLGEIVGVCGQNFETDHRGVPYSIGRVAMTTIHRRFTGARILNKPKVESTIFQKN